MTYSIDIDGVISKKQHWSIGDSYLRAKDMFLSIPIDVEVVKRVNQLYEEGHVIILNTSRLWHDYQVTVEWLRQGGVKYHTLIMAKVLADVYVDDRNMTVKEFLNDHN